MRYYKNTMALILTLSLTLVFTACGGKSTSDTNTTIESNITMEQNTTQSAEEENISAGGNDDNISSAGEDNATVTGTDENNTSAEQNTTTPPENNESTAEHNTSTPQDTTAPVLTLNGESKATLYQGVTYTELGATAIDDRDTNVSVIISGNVT